MDAPILVRDIPKSVRARDFVGANGRFWVPYLFHREKEAFLDGGESIQYTWSCVYEPGGVCILLRYLSQTKEENEEGHRGGLCSATNYGV